MKCTSLHEPQPSLLSSLSIKTIEEVVKKTQRLHKSLNPLKPESRGDKQPALAHLTHEADGWRKGVAKEHRNRLDLVIVKRTLVDEKSAIENRRTADQSLSLDRSRRRDQLNPMMDLARGTGDVRLGPSPAPSHQYRGTVAVVLVSPTSPRTVLIVVAKESRGIVAHLC